MSVNKLIKLLNDETRRLVQLGYKEEEAQNKAIDKYLPAMLKPQAF